VAQVRRIPPLSRPAFQLDKWYLDGVAADGRAFIGYWASLRWGWVRLSYAAAIEVGSGGVVQRTSFRRSPAPTEGASGVEWIQMPLGVTYRARPRITGPARPFLDLPTHAVRWHCIAPLAEIRVTTPMGTIEGLGYVERLTLTVKPWTLPIGELQWGRFTGEGTSLVWIEWRGVRPLRLLLEHGQERTLESVSRDTVAGGGGIRLLMCDHRTIRDGPLGGSVLRRPPLRWLAPRSMREAHETKWLSRAEFTGTDGRSRPGWAIHESVRFRSPT
jgi:hypothetical protein